MIKKIGLFFISLLLVFNAACSATEDDYDCDAEDLAGYEQECGYYVSENGFWIWYLYPWITPGIGGKPPAGQRPVPPQGATWKSRKDITGVTPVKPNTNPVKPAQTGSGSQTRPRNNPPINRR